MATSQFEVEDSEDQFKGEPRPGALDEAQDIRLGGALGQPSTVEVDPGHSKQVEKETNDGGENSGSTVESGDGLEELFSALLKDLDGDDRTEAAPPPGRDRGTGDGKAVAQGPGTGSYHVLASR